LNDYTKAVIKGGSERKGQKETRSYLIYRNSWRGGDYQGRSFQKRGVTRDRREGRILVKEQYGPEEQGKEVLVRKKAIGHRR